MEFTDKDIQQAQLKGINVSQLEHQFNLLKRGNIYPRLVRPARIQDGITTFSDQQEEKLIEIFQTYSQFYDWCRFIPASGAASRMFAFLNDYLNSETESIEVNKFIQHFNNFPFNQLIDFSIEGKSKQEIISSFLNHHDLKYMELPKGLIHFHQFEEKLYTAIASQLAETETYSLLKNNKARTHFTISSEHLNGFKTEISALMDENAIEHEVDFSFQKPNTDTIALGEEGNVFRNIKGEMVFRPGGHGAILSNLNELQEDFIFIRNIDNVLAPHNNEEYVHIHKVMGGLMIKLSRIIFSLQKQISDGDEISSTEVAQLKMYFNFNDDVNSLKDFLFRPFRIAGMVKNSGEPGGGPFWIDEEGKTSLQIIESAQINKNDKQQVEIFESSTHFNPVDLCCLLKNYKGEKYDLNEFSNDHFSFISKKSVDGKNITIFEHPGLWNGSMHHWLTLFIEIPSDVFNPVKTINDLLRPNHQK